MRPSRSVMRKVWWARSNSCPAVRSTRARLLVPSSCAMALTCEVAGEIHGRGSSGSTGLEVSARRTGLMFSPSSTATRPSSCMPKRPARPPIWRTSGGRSSRSSRPSNLRVVDRMMRAIGRLRPMPMASVATSTSAWPSRKRAGFGPADLRRQGAVDHRDRVALAAAAGREARARRGGKRRSAHRRGGSRSSRRRLPGRGAAICG